jgi:hypothetical protein
MNKSGINICGFKFSIPLGKCWGQWLTDHLIGGFFVVFAIMGFEPRAYTMNHSASPFLRRVFSRQGLVNYFPGLALNHNPPDLCFLSS